MSQITPETLYEYKEFSPKFLRPLESNIYKIKFKLFKFSDSDTDFVLFDVSDDSPETENDNDNNQEENNIQLKKKIF